MESLEEKFLRYHDDVSNYQRNERGFNAMYEILKKYGNDSETVDIPFRRASREDQLKMIELITPKLEEGNSGYAKLLLEEAKTGYINGEPVSKDYCDGIISFYEALSAEGIDIGF